MDNKVSFYAEIRQRFLMPWNQEAFKSYFIWIIIIFGGISIGFTFYDEIVVQEKFSWHTISKSIGTTFCALIAGSLVDLNLSFKIKNMPSMIINSIGIVGTSIFLLFLIFKMNSNWSILPAIIGYIISLIIWIIANADNENLSDGTYYDKIVEKAGELSQNWEK